MEIFERFWEANTDEICSGYVYDNESEEFICLICGECFEKGIIFKDGEILMEAEKAIKNHILKEHNSVFNYLLNMDKKYTGITDSQKKLLSYFYNGYSDAEIVKEEGDGSTSTIRNYRFKFREKEKQAKIFLALMSMLKNEDNKIKTNNTENLVEIHRGAKMVDERYAITEDEKKKVIKNYIKNDRLINFPSSEKKKIIILQYLITKFEANKRYTEKDVNEIIESFYEDYATLRRYLIQYGFMGRENDCSYYWVNI